jgi:hypothetical protein
MNLRRHHVLDRRTFGRRSFVPLLAAAALLLGSAGTATAAPVEAQAADAGLAVQAAPRLVSLTQFSTNRLLDAHEIASLDYNVVTRPFQSSNTQHWWLTEVGNDIYTIIQVSSGRYLDAHEYSAVDWRVVTRPNQNNTTQAWVLRQQPGGAYKIQQVSSGRYLDAHQSSSKDFQSVTRPSSSSDNQRWRIVNL